MLATGHYRNGVLLTPVTADAIAELLDRPAPCPSVARGLRRRIAFAGSHRSSNHEDHRERRRRPRWPTARRVGDLVRARTDDRRRVAVARNGEVVPRGEWETDRDWPKGTRIEVLAPVAGG